tara:strand:- start:4877 stop:5608 length:732 start_codon:yes stop_codon:yes gene_type:complete
MQQNKNIILGMGKPNTGKSSSLRNLPQSSMVYLNTDLKALPFRNNFMAVADISDAWDIMAYIDEIENNPDVTGAVLDTITFLMGMFERQYVITATDTQAAWGAYGNFYREFIHKIKSGSKDYVILAHEDSVYNETTLAYDTKVPVKGAVGKIGVEADFTTIVGTKMIPMAKLEQHKNALLTFNEAEVEDGVKYVFCTRVTKDHPGEKMRAPMGFWDRKELYIDNDMQLIFDRLNQYYGADQAA